MLAIALIEIVNVHQVHTYTFSWSYWKHRGVSYEPYVKLITIILISEFVPTRVCLVLPRLTAHSSCVFYLLPYGSLFAFLCLRLLFFCWVGGLDEIA